MLDSYESERRPIGHHNVKRAGEPAGARASTSEALPWDLNGRLAHHWIRTPGGLISTLDLVGDGLTMLAGSGCTRREPRGSPDVRIPVACDDLLVRPTVVIVDDHAGFRSRARALLEAEGFDVVGEAEDGVSALVAIGQLHPHVVLLDIQLPDTAPQPAGGCECSASCRACG